MKTLVCFEIPHLRIVSAANKNENFWVKHSRNKMQKTIVKIYLSREIPVITLPCTVKLTRISPRSLDQKDNLPYSFKWISDTIADYIIPGKAAGRADDSKEISWIYNQEKGKPKEYALRVEILKDD